MGDDLMSSQWYSVELLLICYIKQFGNLNLGGPFRGPFWGAGGEITAPV